MSGSQLVIRKKSPATRCDICHMSDEFDPDTETCRRCYNVLIPVNATNSPTIPINEAKSFQHFASKFVSYTFLLMIGALSLTILSGIFQIVPVAIIFAIISFLSGSAFIISLGILMLYMVGTLLASIVQSIYDSLRARS